MRVGGGEGSRVASIGVGGSAAPEFGAVTAARWPHSQESIFVQTALPFGVLKQRPIAQVVFW